MKTSWIAPRLAQRVSSPLIRLLIAGSLSYLAGAVHGDADAQTPAESPAATASPAASPATDSTIKDDLVAAAKAAGNFQTFLKAVDAAGLTGTLQKPGPYTVFAPTDAAFAKLPPATLENLLKPENKTQLVALLSYHVSPGKYSTADLVKVDEVKTLEGTEVDIEASSDGKTIEVDEGKIIPGGIEASNGIIHALDTVLQP